MNLSQGGALSPRLQQLLQKQSRVASTERLAQRLGLVQLPPSKLANPGEPVP